jgi:hypothetical protein
MVQPKSSFFDPHRVSPGWRGPSAGAGPGRLLLARRGQERRGRGGGLAGLGGLGLADFLVASLLTLGHRRGSFAVLAGAAGLTGGRVRRR